MLLCALQGFKCFQSILRTWIILVNKSRPTETGNLQLHQHTCDTTVFVVTKESFETFCVTWFKYNVHKSLCFLLHNWFLLFLSNRFTIQNFFWIQVCVPILKLVLYCISTCTCTCTMLYLTHLCNFIHNIHCIICDSLHALYGIRGHWQSPLQKLVVVTRFSETWNFLFLAYTVCMIVAYCHGVLEVPVSCCESPHDVPLSSRSGTSVPRRRRPSHHILRGFDVARRTSLYSTHNDRRAFSIAGPTVWNDELRDRACGPDSFL